MSIKNCAVIGLGRFGALFAEILSANFEVVTFDIDASRRNFTPSGTTFVDELRAALSADAIFYAVPISLFESVLEAHVEEHRDLLSGKLLVDLLSVKVHPAAVFARLLPALPGARALCMHPMFGPDSVERRADVLSIKDLKIVMDASMAPSDAAELKDVFGAQGAKVLDLSCDEHDRQAAESQGLTHFVGRILDEFNMKATDIDTAGATGLLRIREQVSRDSWQLFVDLQTYNPYTIPMRVKLSAAQDKVFNKLLPNRIFKDRLVIGIQGGAGSFNEEAATHYMSRTPEQNYELVYLHTTENVLKALHEGRVDRGQFAMHNSIGGIVTESVEAMSSYNFEIVEEFAIKIAHALMIAPDAEISEIEKIMSHPQVYRQCAGNLKQKYPHLPQESGEGELVDHAKVAQLLGLGTLPKSVATMGSKVLARLNGLKIVEDNLQDLSENFTSFLFVQRPS
ncbi:MAG: prephenate dehydrogenase/arogenate dehydrogenase family protein [Candidatus Obscuribacterales bacterium]|nr:prephenate dehydrogenase/arogenate dehydrogenase family protein [Candidatus Obscuribacterales bacterium]